MTTDTYQKAIDLQVRQTADRPRLLPLFAWAEAHTSQKLPMAVRYVRRLTGASPSTARLYAELAGLSSSGENGNV